MKQTKRTVFLTLAIVLSMLLAACGNSQQVEDDVSTIVEASVTESDVADDTSIEVYDETNIDTPDTSTAIDTDIEIDEDAQAANVILEDVLNQYSELLSGLISYYDFAGAEVTQREGEYAITSDYFVSLFAGWFDEKTGYFQFSDEEKENLVENGYLLSAYYDINGDGIEEMLIRYEEYADETIAVWAVQDGSPVKVCSEFERYPLMICSDGAIVRYGTGGMYEHTYTFYSFDSLLQGTDEVLEEYTIADYEGESIWDYTDYVNIEDQLDWTAISIR